MTAPIAPTPSHVLKKFDLYAPTHQAELRGLLRSGYQVTALNEARWSRRVWVSLEKPAPSLGQIAPEASPLSKGPSKGSIAFVLAVTLGAVVGFIATLEEHAAASAAWFLLAGAIMQIVNAAGGVRRNHGGLVRLAGSRDLIDQFGWSLIIVGSVGAVVAGIYPEPHLLLVGLPDLLLLTSFAS